MGPGGDRPKMITCPDCGKEFSRRYNMERHRDTQHATAYESDDTDVSTEESFSDTDQVRQNRDHLYGNITV